MAWRSTWSGGSRAGGRFGATLPASTLRFGSIIDFAKPGDTIWGSGLLDPEAAVNVRDTKVLAVRGPLTASALQSAWNSLPRRSWRPGVALAQSLRRREAKEPLRHRPRPPSLPAVRIEREFGGIDGVKVISVAALPKDVVEEVLGCRRILSSSLHGLIAAHVFGLPSLYVRFLPAPRAISSPKGTGGSSTRTISCRSAEDHPPQYILDHAALRQAADMAKYVKLRLDLQRLVDAWRPAAATSSRG